ncbi:MAG: SBBP repeat-containing protein [Bryobacteraceae bacterium]|nr:SBBP repeat-containing protein [Bryobacteraceae bacterium]
MAVSFGGSGIGYNFPGSHGSSRDTVTQVAVDRAGNIHLVGTTYSTDFPQVRGLQPGPSRQCNFNCDFRALFAAKLSPDGQTVRYRTYISAPDDFRGYYGQAPLLPSALALDSDGNAYIGGATAGENFPDVDGGVKLVQTAGATDAFLLKLDPNGRVLASMLIGGGDDDAFTSMVIGDDRSLYLAGTTNSPNFPVTPGAYRTIFSGRSHVFVTKVKLPERSVVFSALLGEAGEASSAPDFGASYQKSRAHPVLRVDSGGSVRVAVSTNSPNWPTTPGALQPRCADQCSDIVLARLTAAGDRLLFCTYLGGSGEDVVGGIALDRTGNAYLTGRTVSSDFPVTEGAFEAQRRMSPTPTTTAFVAKLNADGTRLEYGTYFGGSGWDEARDIAVDQNGVAYFGGRTASRDFPLLDAIQVGLHNGLCAQFTPSGSIPTGFYYCGSSGFAAALNLSGNFLVWSTNIGLGSVFALALDPSGRV